MACQPSGCHLYHLAIPLVVLLTCLELDYNIETGRLFDFHAPVNGESFGLTELQARLLQGLLL